MYHAKSKNQYKLIFTDAHASCCGPCKKGRKNTFPNKDAGDFSNKNFINAAIDVEKGDEPVFSDNFKVAAWPFLIITDELATLLLARRER